MQRSAPAQKLQQSPAECLGLMQVLFALGWTASRQTQQRTVVTAIDLASTDSMDIVEAPLSPPLLSQALRLPSGLHSKSAAVLNPKVGSNLLFAVMCTVMEGLQCQV